MQTDKKKLFEALKEMGITRHYLDLADPKDALFSKYKITDRYEEIAKFVGRQKTT